MNSTATAPSPAVARILDKFAKYANHSGVARLFEETIQTLYTNLLRAGDSAVDIGAHGGRHTLPMAKCVGRTGTVLAFEPIPQVHRDLAAKVRDAGWQRVVSVIPTALSKEAGSSDFTVVLNAPGHSGLKAKPYAFEAETEVIRVEVATLDSFAAGQERKVAFIKCDAEGGDFHALQGAREVLTKHRPVVAFEWGKFMAPRYGYTMPEFFAYFADLRYRLRDILGCPVSMQQSSRLSPWYFVAYPDERAEEVVDVLCLSVAENIIGFSWN